eukprot:COSAG01_NODE_44102_length_422_cov_1.699690_1_plen_73_part_00
MALTVSASIARMTEQQGSSALKPRAPASALSGDRLPAHPCLHGRRLHGRMMQQPVEQRRHATLPRHTEAGAR